MTGSSHFYTVLTRVVPVPAACSGSGIPCGPRVQERRGRLPACAGKAVDFLPEGPPQLLRAWGLALLLQCTAGGDGRGEPRWPAGDPRRLLHPQQQVSLHCRVPTGCLLARISGVTHQQTSFEPCFGGIGPRRLPRQAGAKEQRKHLESSCPLHAAGQPPEGGTLGVEEGHSTWEASGAVGWWRKEAPAAGAEGDSGVRECTRMIEGHGVEQGTDLGLRAPRSQP